MKANISFKKILYVVLILCSSYKTFSQCFDIESVLVAACTSAPNSEGLNEMVRFKVGAAPVNTATMNVTWATPGVAWLGLIQNATTASKVAALNAGIPPKEAAGNCWNLQEVSFRRMPK